jgi:hypothetical protein
MSLPSPDGRERSLPLLLSLFFQKFNSNPFHTGFYGNQAGESEVQEALDLLGRIRIQGALEDKGVRL